MADCDTKLFLERFLKHGNPLEATRKPEIEIGI